MKTFEGNFSNKELFDLKGKILSDAKNNFEEKSYQFHFSCVFHGISLNFHFQEIGLYNNLKKLIPKSWQGIRQTDYDIYIISPKDMGYLNDYLGEEESPECIIDPSNSTAIQRDFVATYQNKFQLIVLICGEREDGLFNFLRWFLPQKLLLNHKYILHSACVIGKDNKAHFFLGHSGAGKSTIASLSSPRIILGDDMNLLAQENECFVAKAAGIGGKCFKHTNFDESYKIGSLNWIVQSTENKKILLPPSTACQKLMASFANLFWTKLSQKQLSEILDISFNVTKSTPLYELHFRKDKELWDYVDGEYSN